MPDRLEVDEKYTVIGLESGSLRVERYGEPWRNLVGDKLVLVLAQELLEAREKIRDLEGDAASARSDAGWAQFADRQGGA